MSEIKSCVDISSMSINDAMTSKLQQVNPNQPTTATNLGLDVKKSEDFSSWYTQVYFHALFNRSF